MGAPWPDQIQLQHKNWRDAQEWLIKTKEFILANKETDKFAVPSSATMQSKPTVDIMKECHRKWKQKEEPLQGEDFDSFRLRRSAFYKLQPLPQSKQKSCFVQYSCSCPQYLKRAFCKHSIGVGFWKNRCNIVVLHYKKQINMAISYSVLYFFTMKPIGSIFLQI
jgi:hypothetical protein